MKVHGFLAFASSLVLAGTAAAQSTADRIVVPFSDPSKPGLVRVGLISGSITVTGYPGKEVLIIPAGDETGSESDEGTPGRTPRPPHAPEPPLPPGWDKDHDRDPEDRSHGLRRIPNLSGGLAVEEADNVIEVSSGSWGNSIDLRLQVPVGTSLELSTVNDGNIVVRGVDGEINAENTNGEVTLRNVSGSVVAHALNGDVVVSLQRLDPKRGMSFSSLNGNIDVTLPANAKADVVIKSDNGEIFTDFDLKLGAKTEAKSEEVEPGKPGKRKRKHYGYTSTMSGTLNGGGPSFRFETFNGNIYIRKAK